MQWLRSLIARAPKRATAIGKALFLAGGVLVLAALFGRIGLVSVNGERAQAGLSTLHTLDATETINLIIDPPRHHTVDPHPASHHRRPRPLSPHPFLPGKQPIQLHTKFFVPTGGNSSES